MWLLALFVAVPMIEIALFIQVGSAIGLGWTLLIVLLTAIAGTFLVRAQGLQVLSDLRRSLHELHDPSAPLAHGAMILFSGALLLTPGFFTDAVGFLLLVPGVRSALIRHVAARVKVERFQMGPERQANRPAHSDIIDGEYHDVPPEHRPTHKPSGWTRH